MKNLYSFYDSASGVYSAPIALPADAVALRVFRDILVSGDSDMSKYPKDFSMYRVASFDETCGVLTPCASPVFIVSADEIVKAISEKKEN